jgi:hypothetical protein
MMADVTETSDIRKVRYIVPTRKVVPKRKRLDIRDRPGQQQGNNKKNQPNSDKPKKHIDVYA